MGEGQHNYEEWLKFEHELINRRVTWLLTSQTILFAGYAVALKEHSRWLLGIVACTGALIAILVWIGILAGFTAKVFTWLDFKRTTGTNDDKVNANAQLGVRTWITCLAFIPEALMPLVFTVAWAILLCKTL